MPLFTIPPMGSIDSESNVVSYVNALYSIEILRLIDVENADYQVAHQYGQKLNTPWKDNPQLVHNFLHEHRDELNAFMVNKAAGVVHKLMKGTELFNTEVYRPLPISPNEFNSILSGIDSIKKNKLMSELFLLEERYPYSSNSPEFQVKMNHASSNFGELHVIDKLLCGVFDNYATTQEDLNLRSLKNDYGVYRKESLDDKVYVCSCLREDLKNAAFSGGRMVVNFKFWATLLSIFYRSVVPQNVHPNRLERLYEKYILPQAAKTGSLAFGRKFSASTPEAVLCHHLPYLDCEYKEDTVLPHHYQGTAVAPNSLVEHYLVTQHLLEYLQPTAE